MRISVANRTSFLRDAEVAGAVAAVQRQIDEHLGPAWGARADVLFVPSSTRPAADAWLVAIVDSSDEPGDVGYHECEGRPAGLVGARTALDEGGSWSATLSHEVLEMIVDPWATVCVQVEGEVYALEICDPVEGQPYTIDGILVEDFVLPSYYRLDGAAPWNQNALAPLRGPLTVAGAGYNQAAPIGKWAQRNANQVRDSKRAARPGSWRARRASMANPTETRP